MPSYVRFKNSTSGNMAVYWINYSGQRDTSAKRINHIASVKFFDLSTFMTDPFIRIGSNGK